MLCFVSNTLPLGIMYNELALQSRLHGVLSLGKRRNLRPGGPEIFRGGQDFFYPRTGGA